MANSGSPRRCSNKLADQGETFAAYDAAREHALAAGLDDFGSQQQTISLGSRAPGALSAGRRRIFTPARRFAGGAPAASARPLSGQADRTAGSLGRARAGSRILGGAGSATVQWRTATYAQMRASARNVAQALLDRPLSAERPIAILSGNDIEHAALGLGAMYAGIPFAPISPAYSLVSSDFGKLRLIFDILTPGLVFVSAGAPFRKALAGYAAARCRARH